MKPVIVIHVDALRREYPSAWLLAQQIEQTGCRVILTSRISTPHLLRLFTPDVLILSHPFSLPQHRLHGLMARGVKVYVSEVEGVLEDDAAIASTYPAGLMDYNLLAGVFVWNTWSRNWLIAHRAIDPGRVHAIGSIRNNLIDTRRDRKPRLTVGILSRFETINTADSLHSFQNLLVVDPEDQGVRWYFDRCAVDAEACAIVARMIGILTTNGVAVSIRPHPNENVSSYRLFRQRFGPLVTIDSSYDITEWLSKVTVVAGPTSTAYTEPYRAGIPIVSTEKIQQCHYSGEARSRLMNEFARAAHMPDSVAEAAAMCMDPALGAKTCPSLDAYFARFYNLDDSKNPIDRVVSIVTEDSAGVSPRSTWAKATWGRALKLLIDCGSLCRLWFSRHPIRGLFNMRQYDYNSVLHRPNAYMKALQRRMRSV
jgi:surface carbohydrate biosynthesis protein